MCKQSPFHTQIPNHHPINNRSLSIRAVGRDDVGGGGDRANAGFRARTQTHARGICTYDSVIHFYHMHDGMATPRMLVVPDADEPYSVSIFFYFVFVFRVSSSISFRTGNFTD